MGRVPAKQGLWLCCQYQSINATWGKRQLDTQRCGQCHRYIWTSHITIISVLLHKRRRAQAYNHSVPASHFHMANQMPQTAHGDNTVVLPLLSLSSDQMSGASEHGLFIYDYHIMMYHHWWKFIKSFLKQKTKNQPCERLLPARRAGNSCSFIHSFILLWPLLSLENLQDWTGLHLHSFFPT